MSLRSRGSQSYYGCVGLMLTLGGAASAQQAPVPPAIPVAQNPSYFAQATKALVDTNIGTPGSLPQNRRAVERNRQALELVRSGLTTPTTSALVRPVDMNAALPELTGYRSLARLLTIEGQVKEANRDWLGAANSYLDAIELGQAVSRDSILIGLLTAMAMEATGRKFLWDVYPRLDKESTETVLNRLNTLLKRQPLLAASMQAEASLSEKSIRQTLVGQIPAQPNVTAAQLDAFSTLYRQKMEWETAITRQPYILSPQKPLPLLPPDDAQVDEPELLPDGPPPQFDPEITAEGFIKILKPTFTRTHFSFTRNQTQHILLLTTIALHAYEQDHNTPATSLSQLVPKYFKNEPQDPFGLEEPLRTVQDDGKLVVYSIGPDGIDNQGTPIGPPDPKTRRYPAPQAESEGDIVAGVNF